MKEPISRRIFLKRVSQAGLLAAAANFASLAAACAPAAAPAAPTAAPKAAASASGAPAAAADAKKLVLSSAASPDVPAAKGLLKFADLVKEKSGGKLVIDAQLNGTLYDEAAGIRAVNEGSLDLAVAAQANMANFTESLFFMDLPFLITSKAGLRKVMASPAFDNLRKTLEEKNNLKVVMMTENSVRQIETNKKLVKVPADLKGMKIRAPGTPIEVAMWKAWGANPTAIAWLETYTALSQGLVDGEGVQPPWVDLAKHFEVLKYVTVINYNYVMLITTMKADKFKALSPDFQKVLQDAAKEAETFVAQIDDQAMADVKAKTEKAGVTWYTPTPDEMKLWLDTGPEIWAQFKDKVPPDLIKSVQDAQK